MDFNLTQASSGEFESLRVHRGRDSTLTASSRTLVLLILLILITICFLRDFYLLSRYPVAVGIDGYYYVLQIENLHSKGILYFKNATPLCMYLLAGLKFFLKDSAVTLKAGALILHLLLLAGVYALLKALTKETFYALSGLILVAASRVHLFMISEFINNLAAITLLVWSGYFVILAAKTRHPMARIGAMLCSILAVLSHRSAAFLILALIGSIALYRWSKTPNLTKQKKVALWIVVAGVLLSPKIVGAQSLFTLPVWISSELIAPSRIMTLGRIALLEKALLFLASISFLLIIRRPGIGQTARGSALGGIAVMSLIFTLNPFLNRDAGWLNIAERMSAVAYVQLGILLPGLLCFSMARRRKVAIGLCTAVVVCFAAISVVLTLPFGLQKDYLSQRTELISDLANQKPVLSEIKKVIAPHGDQFVVTYALGVPSQHESASGEEPGTYWLLQHFTTDQRYASEGLVVLNAERGTLLVRDDQLDSLLNRTPGWRDLLPSNPHLIPRLLHQNSEQVRRTKSRGRTLLCATSVVLCVLYVKDAHPATVFISYG